MIRKSQKKLLGFLIQGSLLSLHLVMKPKTDLHLMGQIKEEAPKKYQLQCFQVTIEGNQILE